MKSVRKNRNGRPRKPEVPVTIGKYTFNVIITPNDPDGYLVTCPALPGLVTQGDTLEEAREMAADALACHLESMIEDGLPIPEDLTFITPVSVKVA
ncbi:MAG: antitoxin HicB [Pyrinomonadaceae bacterium]|jgi:predicted RNase H-like HicB family nuclease|nr:antitoxin HicB [Pyrinomonadaceae bacterium]